MYIARLKRFDPQLHFVVNLTEELALKQALKADEEIKAGRYRGPFHGIPYGLKDLFSVKGYPTTCAITSTCALTSVRKAMSSCPGKR